MISSELERLVRESIERGHRPYFVNCTCGSTVLGAFDPINPIADICEKYNLWLHIDVSVSLAFGTLSQLLIDAFVFGTGGLGWWMSVVFQTAT